MRFNKIILVKNHIIKVQSNKDTLNNSRSNKLFKYRTISRPEIVNHGPIELNKYILLGFDENKNPYAIYNEDLPREALPFFVSKWIIEAKKSKMSLKFIAMNLIIPNDISDWFNEDESNWSKFTNSWFHGWNILN